MTDSETRVLVRTATVLLVVSAVRYGWELRRAPTALAEGPDDLPTLLTESRRLETENERRSRPLGPDERIDPNRASAVELDRLPGVGPAAARAIVADRDQNGPFGGADALQRVRGIGPATLDRMRPHLSFEITGVPIVPLVGRRRGGTGAGRLINLNRATAEELEGLPGVGPALARRIAEFRRARGRLRQVDELLEVRGIGSATLDRLRSLVTVGVP